MSKGKQAEPSGDTSFQPLEVPRPTVEVSLVVVYNQFLRNKAAVIEGLQRYSSPDEAKIMTNKSTAIVDVIGPPLVRTVPVQEKKNRE